MTDPARRGRDHLQGTVAVELSAPDSSTSGLGRKVGIRPGDLVGLIANESNLSGREIGPIKITEQFSIVGVPEARVDDVITSLRGTLLKGKRPNARRYTE